MTYVPFTDRATGKGHLRSCEVINSCWSINRDVIAPKTCKWYQSVCLVMLRWLVSSRTFLGQILKLNYHGYQVSFYFYDIWWPQYWPDPQRLFTKVGVLSTNYQTSLTVFRFPSFFFSMFGEGGKKVPLPIPNHSEPARNRVKCCQSARGRGAIIAHTVGWTVICIFPKITSSSWFWNFWGVINHSIWRKINRETNFITIPHRPLLQGPGNPKRCRRSMFVRFPLLTGMVSVGGRL